MKEFNWPSAILAGILTIAFSIILSDYKSIWEAASSGLLLAIPVFIIAGKIFK